MAGEGWPVRCSWTLIPQQPRCTCSPIVGPLGPAPPACPVTDTNPDRRALSTLGQAAMGQQEGHLTPSLGSPGTHLVQTVPQPCPHPSWLELTPTPFLGQGRHRKGAATALSSH